MICTALPKPYLTAAKVPLKGFLETHGCQNGPGNDVSDAKIDWIQEKMRRSC